MNGALELIRAKVQDEVIEAFGSTDEKGLRNAVHEAGVEAEDYKKVLIGEDGNGGLVEASNKLWIETDSLIKAFIGEDGTGGLYGAWGSIIDRSEKVVTAINAVKKALGIKTDEEETVEDSPQEHDFSSDVPNPVTVREAYTDTGTGGDAEPPKPETISFRNKTYYYIPDTYGGYYTTKIKLNADDNNESWTWDESREDSEVVYEKAMQYAIEGRMPDAGSSAFRTPNSSNEESYEWLKENI